MLFKNRPLLAKLSSSQNIIVKGVFNSYVCQAVVNTHGKRQVETSTIG